MLRLMMAGFVIAALTNGLAAEPTSANQLFEQTKYDFGTVPRGAQLLRRFTWTNTEKTRLEVSDIRVTCACVTATPTPKAVEPGQKGVIEVLVDAKKFIGAKTIHVHIALSGEKAMAATLELNAHSRPDIVFNPGEVDFGARAAGTAAAHTLDIEYAGQLDWRVEELICRSPLLEARHEELYRKPGQVGYRVTVTLKADAPPGDLKEELVLRTNDPNAKVIPVLVVGTLRTRLTATPNPVFFGTARVGQTVTRRIAVRGDKPFTITSIEGAPKDLSIAKGSTAGIVQVVILNWTPTGPGELNAALTIQSDLEPNGKVTVAVQGQAGE